MPMGCCSTARSTASAKVTVVDFPNRVQHQRLRTRSFGRRPRCVSLEVYKNADYATAPVEVNGFVFEGRTRRLGTSEQLPDDRLSRAKFNYVHSTMGGLAVGNYDSPIDTGDSICRSGRATHSSTTLRGTFLTDIVFPGSKSNTAYGIWYNGGTSYTICGGYSLDPVNNFDDQNKPIGQGYLVDYDSLTGQFTNWTSFAYPARRQLRHPLRGHQQRREGRLHAQRRLGPGRHGQSRLRARGSRSAATPTARSADAAGSTSTTPASIQRPMSPVPIRSTAIRWSAS